LRFEADGPLDGGVFVSSNWQFGDLLTDGETMAVRGVPIVVAVGKTGVADALVCCASGLLDSGLQALANAKNIIRPTRTIIRGFKFYLLRADWPMVADYNRGGGNAVNRGYVIKRNSLSATTGQAQAE